MKILITGAGGFLGRRMIEPFESNSGYELRLMDVVPFESRHEAITADVTDYDAVRSAVAGMDAVIIAHMAPRGEDSSNYKTPEMPMDINVKGTVNLFHAAAEEGIKRIVLISSGAAVSAHDRPDHSCAPKAKGGYYPLSKACQELIAEQFSRCHDMAVAALRVGYVLDGEENADKYGRRIRERNYADTDCRDIGEVARLALECRDLTYEALHVMSTQESLTRWDVQYTCDRLNWKPAYDFAWLPGDNG